MFKRTLIILIGLFVFLWSSPNNQDPPKKQEPQDTTRIVVERHADSLHIQQSITKMKLDSIYNKKKQK